jgi:hypothetical protein
VTSSLRFTFVQSVLQQAADPLTRTLSIIKKQPDMSKQFPRHIPRGIKIFRYKDSSHNNRLFINGKQCRSMRTHRKLLEGSRSPLFSYPLFVNHMAKENNKGEQTIEQIPIVL